MAKTCPSAGKSNVQAVFACIEDVTGVLQKPTAADYIVPRGNASMNQVPTSSASEELSESLNVIDHFQDAVDPGEASIPMILRLPSDGGRMQGHALMLAAMGNVQEPDTVTAELGLEVDESADTLSLESITGGTFPPRGVVQIEDEKIFYMGVTQADGVVNALTGCVRGYDGTTAATHADMETVTLKSRVYTQDTCRHTVSIWMKNDHLVTFGSGGVVTATEFGMSNEGGQTVDVTVQFRQMGWSGRSFVSGVPSGQVLTVVDENNEPAAMAYTVGGYIRNTTKNTDNGGAGYRIAAVDYDAGTITVDGSISGWADGDQLDAWLPSASPIGNTVESRSARVFIDGKTGKVREGSISIGTPTEFLYEIGDEYPGESVDTKREISMSMDAYMRAREAKELGRGYEGYEIPVAVLFGRKAGEILSVFMPRVKMVMPEIGTDGAAFTLSRTGTALGVKGEDALFVIQE